MIVQQNKWRAGLLIAVVAGLLAVGPVGPADLRAEGPDCDEPAGDDIGGAAMLKVLLRLEKKATDARELVSRLGLTQRQAHKLLPIIEQAAKVHVKAYELQAEILPQEVKAYKEFAREDSLDRGFSKDVERTTSRIHRRAIQTRDRANEGMLDIERRVAAVLTPAQRQFAIGFEPGQTPHQEFRTAKQWRRHLKAMRKNPPRHDAKPYDRLDEARDQLHELHKERHPQPSEAGKRVLNPMAAEVIYAIARTEPPEMVRRAAQVYHSGTEEHPLATVLALRSQRRRLNSEISNWNLINGLHLGRDQIDRIVALYDNAAMNIHRARTSRMDGSHRLAQRMTTTLEKSVERILSPGQLAVLADFNPCLIPPKNLKDPVRVGQASDHSHYERVLDRARKVRPNRAAELADRVLEREADHIVGLCERDWEQRRALLIRTIRRVSAMSEVDFELKKADLAEKIAPPDVKKDVKGEIASIERWRGLPSRTAKLFLKPQFIEQLRIRSRQLAAGAQEQRVTQLGR